MKETTPIHRQLTLPLFNKPLLPTETIFPRDTSVLDLSSPQIHIIIMDITVSKCSSIMGMALREKAGTGTKNIRILLRDSIMLWTRIFTDTRHRHI